MTAQNIHRSTHTANFTVLPNSILTSTTLSGNAKALLSYLLSRPSHWKVRIKDLQKILQVGRDRVYRYLKELVSAGYATMTLIQKGVRWEFFDTPQTSPTPETTGPAHLTEIQYTESQYAVERNEIHLLERKKRTTTAPELLQDDRGFETPIVVVQSIQNNQVVIDESSAIFVESSSIHEIKNDPPQSQPLIVETPHQAPAVVANRDNIGLHDPCGNIKTPEAPEVSINDALTELVQPVKVAEAIKPTLVKTLSTITLVEAKAILTILTRALVLGNVHNPIGYTVQLVKAARNGSLTVSEAHHQPTLAERLAKEERARQEASERGKMDNAQWAVWFEQKFGIKPDMTATRPSFKT